LHGTGADTGESTMQATLPGEVKREVREFWTRNPLQLDESSQPTHTRAFFEDITRARYAREWHILEMTDFRGAAGQRVLEIGCGLGTDGAQFARAGAHYTGIDLTFPAVQVAGQRFTLSGEPRRFAQADAEHLPFPDASFDQVYSYGVIHHTPDIRAAVAELHRVLVPGGRATVAIYRRDSWNTWRIQLLWQLLRGLGPDLGPRAAAKLGQGNTTRLAKIRALALHDPELAWHEFFSEHTDSSGNPLSQMFDPAEARRLFGHFASVRTSAAFWLHSPSLERLLGRRRYRQVMRRLGHANGWMLYVYATKAH
jgi:ubiquinone/menaquinone biosynthesis C-methylase UbiE